MPRCYCNHIQLSGKATQEKSESPRKDLDLISHCKSLAKILSQQVIFAGKPNPPRTSQELLPFYSTNSFTKKNAKQIIFMPKLTLKKKAINSISETDITGRLNFSKTARFRILHRCEEQAFYLVLFSPVGSKFDGTAESFPYANSNVGSQICFQQGLHLQKSFPGLFVEWP